MRDLASCVEYPSLTAKSSRRGFSQDRRNDIKLRTSLKLESPAQHIQQKLHHGIHGCKSVGEEDKSNDDGEFLVEAKGLVQRAIVDEDGE
jgi:hypothetical protein